MIIAVFHNKNLAPPEARRLKGLGMERGCISAVRIRARSHFGRTKEALGSSVSKDRSKEGMAGPCVMSLRSVV